MTKIRRSKYTSYFDINYKKENAVCNRCAKTFQMKNGNTKGLKKHLKDKHNIDIDKNTSKDNSASSVQSLDDEKSGPSNIGIRKYFPTKTPPLEELVSIEAARGASFRYITKSKTLGKGFSFSGNGYKPPKSSNTVRRLVHKSAENHRKIIREKLKKMTEEDQRFCAVTDEWTCPVKRRRYLNVSLHLKGKIYLQHGLTNSNNLFEPAKHMFCQEICTNCIVQSQNNFRTQHQPWNGPW